MSETSSRRVDRYLFAGLSVGVFMTIAFVMYGLALVMIEVGVSELDRVIGAMGIIGISILGFVGLVSIIIASNLHEELLRVISRD